MPTPDTLAGLQALARDICLPSTPADIHAALRRIRRDIAQALDDQPHARHDLERELGNLILSALRWVWAYGLDMGECLAVAEQAQRAKAAQLEARDG